MSEPESIENIEDVGTEEVVVTSPPPTSSRPQARRMETLDDKEFLSPEVKDVFSLRSMMKKEGDKPLSIVEYMMLSDHQERKDEKRRERERRDAKKTPEWTPENLTKSIVAGIKEVLPKPPEKHETSEEMKQLLAKMEGLERENAEAKRLREEEKRAAETKQAVKEATENTAKPLQEEINKQSVIIENLEERIKTIDNRPSPPSGGVEDQLSVYERVDGILAKRSGATSLGPSGMPVTGEIPAWAAWGPDVAARIVGIVEKAFNNVAKNLGILEGSPGGGKQPSRERIIHIPPKPKVVIPPSPPPTPQSPQDTPPPTPDVGQVEAEVVKEEEKSLLKLPEKPKVEQTIDDDFSSKEEYRKQLESKKMVELWKISKVLKIDKKGKKKTELIDEILKRSIL